MSILPLEFEYKQTNPILRAQSKKVHAISSPEIQKLILNMHETLASTDNGVGLAAPQVGKNLCIFVASSFLKLRQTVFINPAITKIYTKKEIMEEGCLSIPDKYGQVERAVSVKVEAYNQNGRKFKMKVTGLAAQLMQHEIGHLNGELFIDIARSVYNIKDLKENNL